MHNPAIHDLDASGLVRRITDEIEGRCDALERMAEASLRLEGYGRTVVEFVRTINSDFFQFVELLHRALGDSGLGKAELRMRREQSDLTRCLDPREDWPIRRFSLLKADLTITLRYLVHGEETHPQTVSATVLFMPHGGVLEWPDGTRELFRSHRENATGDPRFGAPEFLDLVAMLGIPKRGRVDVGGGRVREEPELLVVRRICQDDRWAEFAAEV